MKCQKSSGPDQILNEMIKYGSEKLLVAINKLFNLVLNSGRFPDKWKESYIITIHKSGDNNDPSNYRVQGISLSSTLGKLLSAILK